jgi:hypothetical protein
MDGSVPENHNRDENPGWPLILILVPIVGYAVEKSPDCHI